MKTSHSLSYIFRKSSLFRAFCLLVIIGIAVSIILIVGYKTKAEPEIESIVPPVGMPGDIIVINGNNFGDSREMGYVEFAGSKLTASSYLSWDNECIKVVLPVNVQDGLVVVGTKNMRSKPVLFANEVDIPVLVPMAEQGTRPVISGLSSSKVSVGDLLTITGNNFGDIKGSSKVLFSINYNGILSSSGIVTKVMLADNVVEASEFDGDYEYWSNTEIRVHVPEGAYNGVVVVDTGKEKSEPVEIEVSSSGIEKVYSDKKIYLVQYSADIDDVIAKSDSTISLRCPLPVEVPSQPKCEVTDISPAPVISNYQNCIIHQITKNRNNLQKQVFNQTFVLNVYEVNSNVINLNKIGSYKSLNPSVYKKYTEADVHTPKDDARIVAIVKSTIGKETNPYKKARKLYDYMLSNYKLIPAVKGDDSDVLNLLEEGEGDAYDFAAVYTCLLRAAEIPAVMDSGILIGKDLMTQAHWWTEFYVPNAGWLPVDVALGNGMEYTVWDEAIDAREYYFGNLDSHHIVFSRGWTTMKPFAQDSKIVRYPKSFALQDIWEESSGSSVNYSSYWSLPVIKGIY